MPRGRDDPGARRDRAGARGAAPTAGPTVVVLPGPAARAAADVAGRRGDRGLPRGRRAARTRCARRCCGCSASPSRRSRRRCALAEDAGMALDGLEITTCLRRGEIEMVTRYAPGGSRVYERFAAPSPSATPTRCSPTTGARWTSRWPSCCARRADDRHRRVVHGRAAGRAADRPARARRPTCWAGWSSTPTRPRSRWPASIRRCIERVRRGLDRGRRGAGRRRARGASAPTSAWASPASPGPGGGTRGEARRDRVLQRGGRRRARSTRSVHLPGGRADVRDRSTTVAHAPAAAAAAWASAARRLSRGAPVRRARAARGRPRRRWRPWARAAARDGRCGRSREDALHLTLAFLGIARRRDRSRARGRARRGRLAGARSLRPRPAPLWLAPRRPRVLAVGLEDADGVLAALQAAVVARLADALPWQPEAPAVPAARHGRARAPRWRPRIDDLPEAAAGDLHRRRGGALPLAPGRRRTVALRAARARWSWRS